jgi:dTDP-4-amino-4,6-dideoxygalactose transaminase
MTDGLALEGGSPSVPHELIAHDWERYRKAGDEEIDAVTAVLRSGHLSIAAGAGMPQADALEEEFARWVGTDHCLAVNTGTASLHCAVAGVGVEAGDQVIVPAYTFIASAMVVLQHNAVPVFVDTEPQTYLIDPDRIEEKITARTKAIMVVHLHGLPADMDRVNRIAKRHGLKVIEDSAQAYGARYRDRKTGALGDAAGFAMTTTKHLMTGEGGLLTTASPEIHERASMTRLFGEPGNMKDTNRAYLSERIGWNYKMPEMISALARVRLRHLDAYVSGLQRNAEYLTQRLRHIDGLACPLVPEGRTHSYYIYTVQVDPARLNLDMEPGKLKAAVMKALTAENVDVMSWQSVPVPAQPLFQNKVAYGNGSPWNQPGADVCYDLDDYPNAFAAIDSSFGVRRLVPPNGVELMDRYAEAFQKVFDRIERVVELYDETERYLPLAERKARLSQSISQPISQPQGAATR